MKNVVILVIDALRTKNLSLFGYGKENDRNLKKIAKESIIFRNHFSCSNSTMPSLTSLFTGKYPNNHGIIHQFPYTQQSELDKLKQTKFWFPSYLRDKGYNTIAIDWIGLWLKKGFNYYDEKEEKQSKMKKLMEIPIVKKFLLNLPNWTYKLGKKIIKTRTSAPFSPANETTDLAIAKMKKSKKPFFLFMHFWDTHFPFPTVNQKKCGKDDIQGILKNIKNNSQKEYIKKRITDVGLNSVGDITNKYDLAINTIDKQVGRIYNFLKKENLWKDTIFVILSDHGESLTEHNIYFSHSGLYDVSLHTPLIMHLPGIGNKDIGGMAQNVDVIPTILDHLNLADTTDSFDGKSLLPLILNGKKVRDKAFLFDGLAVDIKGVRSAGKKFIVAKNGTCHLCKANHHKRVEEYDLKKDPEEKKNIYSKKSNLFESIR